MWKIETMITSKNYNSEVREGDFALTGDNTVQISPFGSVRKIFIFSCWKDEMILLEKNLQ